MTRQFGITRRDFLKKAAGGTLSIAAAMSLSGIVNAAPEVKKSRVVLKRRPRGCGCCRITDNRS